jgi:hypothetical protein
MEWPNCCKALFFLVADGTPFGLNLPEKPSVLSGSFLCKKFSLPGRLRRIRKNAKGAVSAGDRPFFMGKRFERGTP